MPLKNKFTKDEINIIKDCILDSKIIKLTEKDLVKYISKRIGRSENEPISIETVRKYKQMVKKEDNNTSLWMKHYSNEGFLEYHKKRIQEMETIQSKMLELWFKETQKQNPTNSNINNIVMLTREIRENNKHITELTYSSPVLYGLKLQLEEYKDIIDEMKNKLDKYKDGKIIPIRNCKKDNPTNNDRESKVYDEELPTTTEFPIHDRTKEESAETTTAAENQYRQAKSKDIFPDFY